MADTQGTNTIELNISADSREQLLAALHEVVGKIAGSHNKLVYFRTEWGEISGKINVKMVEKV